MSVKFNGVTPEEERRQLREYRKKQQKRLSFLYDPNENFTNPNDVTYRFANSSGNAINNDKNLEEMEYCILSKSCY